MDRRALILGAILALAADAHAGVAWQPDPCLDAIVDRDQLVALLAIELGPPDPGGLRVAARCRGIADVDVEVRDRTVAVALGDVPRERRARVLALAVAEVVATAPPPRAPAPPLAPPSTARVERTAVPRYPGRFRLSARATGGAGLGDHPLGVGGVTAAVELVAGRAALRAGARGELGNAFHLAGGFVGAGLDGPRLGALTVGAEAAFEAGGVSALSGTDTTAGYAGGSAGAVVHLRLSSGWDLAADVTVRYLRTTDEPATLVTGGLGLRAPL